MYFVNTLVEMCRKVPVTYSGDTNLGDEAENIFLASDLQGHEGFG
jgi:hypothetical protein